MSWATPMNMMANALDNIQQDPQAQKLMLGMGVAYDTLKNAPIDLFSNIPHFQSEVDGSVSGNLPNSGSA